MAQTAETSRIATLRGPPGRPPVAKHGLDNSHGAALPKLAVARAVGHLHRRARWWLCSGHQGARVLPRRIANWTWQPRRASNAAPRTKTVWFNQLMTKLLQRPKGTIGYDDDREASVPHRDPWDATSQPGDRRSAPAAAIGGEGRYPKAQAPEQVADAIGSFTR